MFDVGLVQRICRKITIENDAGKIEQLVDLLQTIIRDNQEEIRTKAVFLIKKYSLDRDDPTLEFS